MREPSVSHDSRRSQPRSERRHSRCRILIVDSRQRFDSLLHRELRNSGFDAVLQTNGWAEAAMMLRDQSFDVVLAYTPGLRGSEGRFDFFSGSPSLDTIFGEVRDGSHGALHASVDARQLVSAVAAAAARAGAVVQHSRASREMMPVANAGGEPHSAVHRWASYVFKAAMADSDVRTLDVWARSVGASYTTLCESCRVIGIRSHDARDLARALCAAFQAFRLNCPPSVLLNISDSRTLKSFVRRAGSGFQPIHDAAGVARLLQSQEFVDNQHFGIMVLREMLTRRIAPFGTGHPG